MERDPDTPRELWAFEDGYLFSQTTGNQAWHRKRFDVETCYHHADDAGVLAVMESPAKLRERKLGGTS